MLLQRFDRSACAVGAPLAGDGPVCSGAVDAGGTAVLETWRHAPSMWQARALSGAKISDFLLRHGFRPMTPAGVAQVDAAIADPVSGIEDPARLCSAMFGRQLVECLLDAGAAQPRADRLLAELAAAGRPKVDLEELHQALESGRWRVSFRCLGQRHAFGAEYRGSRLDVDAVLSAFNALLAHVAHPCRGYRIDLPAPATRAWIVVTRGDRFEAAARALGIPLLAPRRASRTVAPSRPA
jgi:hypothetical protein